jgi:hypothetical protein
MEIVNKNAEFLNWDGFELFLCDFFDFIHLPKWTSINDTNEILGSSERFYKKYVCKYPMEYLPPIELYESFTKRLNLILNKDSYWERLEFICDDRPIKINLDFEGNNLIIKGISEKDDLPLTKNIIDEVITVVKNWNEKFPTIRLDFQLNVSIKSETMTFTEDSIQRKILYQKLNAELKKKNAKKKIRGK